MLDSPFSSVTVNLNDIVVWPLTLDGAVNDAFAVLALANLPGGPSICVHLNISGSPSGSRLALASNIIVVPGSAS
jgi:hypothetical protein